MSGRGVGRLGRSASEAIGRSAEPSRVTRTLTPSWARDLELMTVVPPARCPWCTPGPVVTLSSPLGP